MREWIENAAKEVFPLSTKCHANDFAIACFSLVLRPKSTTANDIRSVCPFVIQRERLLEVERAIFSTQWHATALKAPLMLLTRTISIFITEFCYYLLII